MSASRTPTARLPQVTDQAPTRRAGREPPARRAGPAAQGTTVLDRYRLHSRLGAGAFGTVWLARDERLERDVAVKVVPRERVSGGRFEREARATARLSHPGIVTLYEAAVDDDGAYLVSELVSGATLDDLLQAGRLSDRDVAQIGVALCDALAHAHAQGVVHRDVKPSNVLVPERVTTPAELAKLTDFGVARVIGGDSLTRTGDVVGTVAYMAPEQAEGRPAGATADLYSLALVLYEAFTGVNPLRAAAGLQRARRLGAYLPPVRRHRRDLPRDLGRAIDLALRPRPKERGSIAELREALTDSLGALGDHPDLVKAAPGEAWRAAPWPPEAGPEPEPAAPESRRWSLSFPAPAPDAPPPVPAGLRLLAGLGAAGVAAGTTATVLHPGPVGPAAAAIAAGLLVGMLLRVGWVLLILGGAALLALDGQTGTALIWAAALILPVVLLLGQPARWPLAAVAVALGGVGLAGAWPALAARAGRPWQRAALGAIGWVWLQVAALLSGMHLYTRLPDVLPARGAWSSSAGAAVHEVIDRLLGTGALTPALAWAGAAVILPALLRQTDLLLRCALVTAWSAVTLGITVLLLSIGRQTAGVEVRSALLGLLAGAVAALVGGGLPRARRLPVGADARQRLA